jgi:hypothetical protein
MPQDQDREVTFTVQIKPETVEVGAYIGPDADETEAFALCERLFSAVRDFNNPRAV